MQQFPGIFACWLKPEQLTSLNLLLSCTVNKICDICVYVYICMHNFGYREFGPLLALLKGSLSLLVWEPWGVWDWTYTSCTRSCVLVPQVISLIQVWFCFCSEAISLLVFGGTVQKNACLPEERLNAGRPCSLLLLLSPAPVRSCLDPLEKG